MLKYLPPVTWLLGYRFEWLPRDIVAGVTLAAYAIPVSLAYAGLAGLPPQVGIYGYLLGGLGYALLGSSRQIAIGPTSAISLMIAASVGAMAGGDLQQYAQIASFTALAVAAICMVAWLLRLSVVALLISDSILVGFKIGAGLTIAATQLPGLLGVPGGGHNFLERLYLLGGQLGDTQSLIVAIGASALGVLMLGDRWMPGRPVALAVVAIAIACATWLGWPAQGVPVTGEIPAGLPSFAVPQFGLREVEGVFPLAAGCFLLAYVEGVSAGRAFAAKHGYALDMRQEFLGVGAANLAAALGHGYPVAGGLSQSAVNDKAGAKTPLALVFASITLALCLVYFASLIENLPKAVLSAVVLTAIVSLFDFRALAHMWRVSRIDFYAASIALAAVLLLGILNGILLASLASVALLLAHASRPHVAILGRVPGTQSFSDMERNPDNEPLPGAIVVRPEGSLIYVNAAAVSKAVQDRLAGSSRSPVRLLICDLSASPFIDLAGARMLHDLHADLAARGIVFRIVGAHSYVRDFLRADGLSDKIGGIDRTITIESLTGGSR
ncbi:MAG: STAS domain-containing protein [Pseudorhodoplanes sp.]|nr:STAS domain-containing protein [Pseudorhodoplanes sp.]